jgi:hypothetical protein
MTDAALANPSATADEETIEVDLRDPRLAAFLAWLIPGAGHFYQGRTAKAILFLICILGTWLFGMYIGRGRVVYFHVQMPVSETRWAFFCQVGVGLPTMPALIQGLHARRNPRAKPLWNGFMAPPKPPEFQGDPGELHVWQQDMHRYFELGTVFTMVAGLLNVLAIYDAFAGPLLIPAVKDPKKAPVPNSDASRNAEEKAS